MHDNGFPAMLYQWVYSDGTKGLWRRMTDSEAMDESYVATLTVKHD